MTLNFADLIQFMKHQSHEAGLMWDDYEKKLNPFATQAIAAK